MAVSQVQENPKQYKTLKWDTTNVEEIRTFMGNEYTVVEIEYNQLFMMHQTLQTYTILAPDTWIISEPYWGTYYVVGPAYTTMPDVYYQQRFGS